MSKPIAKDYMTTQLITLKTDMNVYFAIGLLLNNNISGAPVVDNNNNLLGILSEKDCLRIFTHSTSQEISVNDSITLGRGTVDQFMTTSVSTVNSDMDLFSVAEIFLKNNFRRIPVLEEDKLVGQISRRDVLKAIKDITSYDLESAQFSSYTDKEIKDLSE